MVYIWEYRDPWDEAKVYVRNLPYDVSSERLVQLFGQDVVVEVTVVSMLFLLDHLQRWMLA